MIRIVSFGILMLAFHLRAIAERPNILWLVSEDNTTLLGCYGDSLAKTPTLDKLASEGILFENCFAQPVCAPSRFTLVTGTFAASSGPAHQMRASGKIPDLMTGFPALLRQSGYFTSNHSKTDYNAPIRHDQNWDERGDHASPLGAPAKGKPFFRVFNYNTTHESCLFPEKPQETDDPPTDPKLVKLPPYQPDTPAIRDDWARYYDQITLMDRQISAKLEELNHAGVKDNTIVFYYADNGGVLPRSKRFLHASGTHVPLIVYFPPKWRHLAPAAPGSRVKTPISFVDFAPTVLSLAGVKIPEIMQGRPFAGLKIEANDFVFCTRDRMDERYDMTRSVVDSRWLYIRNFRPDLPFVQPLNYMFKARGYQSWASLAREGKLTAATAQFWGTKPTEELYDREADPHNVNNLAEDPAHSEVLSRMRAALRKHTVEIVDNGFLPEGSALEGYKNSRQPGAYPVERVFEMATLASDRKPAHLPKFIKALADPCEPIRWWAAQGCTMLGKDALAAENELLACLKDESGAVQIAAAEALAGTGNTQMALPVLEHWIRQGNNMAFNLQAGNVLDRLGEKARPSLSAMKTVFDDLGKPAQGGSGENYSKAILGHVIAILEGQAQPLTYPSPKDP